jgi:hypothetical protein
MTLLTKTLKYVAMIFFCTHVRCDTREGFGIMMKGNESSGAGLDINKFFESRLAKIIIIIVKKIKNCTLSKSCINSQNRNTPQFYVTRSLQIFKLIFKEGIKEIKEISRIIKRQNSSSTFFLIRAQ